jgi:hypothetical protein
LVVPPVDYTAKINAARKYGYSDDDIVAHLVLSDPKVKQAVDSGYKPTEIINFISTPQQPVEQPSVFEKYVIDPAVSTAAGFGRGVGNVGLTAQDYLGQGLSAVGGQDFGGDFLQRDAQAGQARLNREAAPYQNRNPFAFGAGKIGGEITGTAPAISAMASGTALAGAPQAANLIRSGGMTGKNFFTRAFGGGVGGATTTALTQPEDTALGTAIGVAVPTIAAPAVQKIAKVVAENAVPATEAIKDAASKIYKQMDASGIRIDPKITQGLATGMRNFVTNTQRYLNNQHTAVNNALAQLDEFAGSPLSITRLNELYKDIRTTAQKVSPGEGSVLNDMADSISTFFDRLSPRELGGASAKDVKALRKANELRQRAFKSETIDEILTKASTKAGRENGAVSKADAIQTGFQNLLTNKTKMRQFSAQEKAMIEKIAAGNYKTKILNMISKLQPNQKLDAKALLYTLGVTTGSAPLAAGLAATGATANAFRNAMVSGQGKNLSLILRNKGPVVAANRFPFPLTQTGVAGGRNYYDSTKPSKRR